MTSAFCPNLSNKQVREEFEELVNAVGENMAYLVWHRNNGYSMRSAPNGAESSLFKALLKKYHGDLKLAILKKAEYYLSQYTDNHGEWYSGNSKEILDNNGEPTLSTPNYSAELLTIKQDAIENGTFMKAPNGKPTRLTERQWLQVRTKAFKEWFGDWENNPESASKVVDENGEPMVVYHGGAKGIQEFHTSTEDESTTGYGEYVDNKTGEKIPLDSNRTMFFSSNPFVATSYASMYGIQYFKQMEALANDILFNSSVEEGLHYTKDMFERGLDDFYEFLTNAAEINPRFEAFKNYLQKIRTEGKRVTKENEKKAFLEMVRELRDKIQDFAQDWLMNHSEWEYVYDRSAKIIDEYNTPEGVKRLINGEIPETIRKEWVLYEKAKAQRKKQGLPEINNYDELHLTLGEGRYYLLYDGKNLSVWNPEYTDPNVSDMTEEQLSKFLNDAKNANQAGKEKIKNDVPYRTVKNKALEYAVFLNLRDPLIHDYEGTKQGSGYKQSSKYPFGYVAARQVNKAINSGNDGVVYQNLYDPYLADNYGVFNPNQIKSATENDGSFSTEDNDIRAKDPLFKISAMSENQGIFLNSTNSSYTLSQLIEKGFISDVFKPFAQILARHSIPIVLSEEHSDTLMSTYVDKEDGVVIAINPVMLENVSTGYAAYKLMHEVVHALTVGGLTEGYASYNEHFDRITTRLFEMYSKLFPERLFNRADYRGFVDKYEFVAEFMTNSEFRTLLFTKAEQLDKQRGNTTVLERLKNFIKNAVDFFIGQESNVEILQKYQMSLFTYINDKNATVNGNIKSKAQLQRLLDGIDTFKHITEGIIEEDEYQQRLLQTISRHDFSLAPTNWINKKIQHSMGYQTRREIREEMKRNTHHVSSAFEKPLDDVVKDICDEISKMLSTRMKAVKVSNLSPSDKQTVLNGLSAQISALESDSTAKINAIAYTLNSILPEVIDECEKLHEAAKQYKEGNYVMSDTDYMYEMHDYFGVYKAILEELQGFFSHPFISEWMKDYKADKLSLLVNTDDFISKINICKNLCDSAISILQNICSANVIARMENIGLETGCSSDMCEYLDKNMGGSTTHDISDIAKLFGSLDVASDYSLKALSYIVNNASIKAERTTNERVAKLIMLQHNLKMGESPLDLYERDEKGLPTGYLIRNLNYGKFKKDYDAFMRELNAKYSTPEEPLDPENRIAPENDKVRVKWATERNNWLGKHCHRRFKAEYYNKFAQLSNITKKRRDEIQSAINAIRSTVLSADGKVYEYDRLSDEDWNQLKMLYMQRRLLACIYDPNGELKQGDDLLIAEELSALNKSLYEGNKAKRNEIKWREARDKIIAECGGETEKAKGRSNKAFDWKKLDAWDERNTKKQFKLDDEGHILLFEDLRKAKYDLLAKKGWNDALIEAFLTDNKTYTENKERINKMLAPYRRLDNGEVDMYNLPELIKQKVIKLQNENAKIRKAQKKALNNKDKGVLKELRDLDKKYYKTPWTQQFADAVSLARKKDAEDAAKMGMTPDDIGNPHVTKLLASHGYIKLIDLGGGMYTTKFTPYSMYTKIVPTDIDKYMEEAPGDNYIEQDPESSFLDPEFDETANETYVPMKSGTYMGKSFNYDNSKQFNRIQNSPTLKALYDGIKDTIHETNEIYSNIPYKNDYQLPGITGSMYRSIVRASKTGKWTSVFKERFGRLYKKTEKDVDYEKIAATRPDGHQLSFVPQPFTAALRNPSEISMDLVGITCEYYAHAQQYKEKSAIKDQCEAIIDTLLNRTYYGTRTVKKGVETNVYQAARKHMNMSIYSQSDGLTELAGVNVNKLFSWWKAWATAVNLGCSIKVAVVGAFSAEYAHLMNAVCGKEYSMREWFLGHMEMLNGLLRSGAGARIIGNNSRLFQLNVMELFNIAEQGEKKYRNTNRNAVVNTITNNWCFGLLTASDYLVKGSILDTTLAAHRFFRGQFLSKDDILMKYGDKNSITGGEEYQKMLQEWKEGKTMLQVLKEAHRKGDRTNMFNIASEYKEAFDKSFATVRNRAQQIGARADGVMLPHQKAAFMTSMVGQAIMMHKQYLQPMMQHYFGEKRFNLETRQWEYGSIRAIADLIIAPYKDAIQAVRLLNQEAGGSENVKFGKKAKAFAKGLKSGIGSQMAETVADPVNRRAVKKLLAEVAIYNFLVYPLVSLLLKKADDDKDDLLLQLEAYIAIATRWEVFTPYRFADILNTIKSPTAMTSVWDGLNSLVDGLNGYKTPENSLWNLFSNVTENFRGDEDTIVKKGAYKGWTKSEKAMFKLTPFKNLREQIFGSYDKRKYAQNQLYKQQD